MASFLRKVVAGPRAPHPEANLDLCYVTDNIIATSGPSSTWPSRAYRNPLPSLVRFLDAKHGAHWAIWEFRAEGTGYPDEEVYGRIWHYPWPDHHPPPFKLIPGIMASMRDWLRGEEGLNTGKVDGVQVARVREGAADGQLMQGVQYIGHDTEKRKEEEKEGNKGQRVVVVHCKAGKGRSGSMVISYLLSEEGWTREAALQRFTERRMRQGFGAGVSIPSQLRWLKYVERWAKNSKIYIEQSVEVLEVHVWGLREGVKIGVEGYVDEGKVIKSFHVFGQSERHDVGVEEGSLQQGNGEKAIAGEPGSTARTNAGTSFVDVVQEAGRQKRGGNKASSRETSSSRAPTPRPPPSIDTFTGTTHSSKDGETPASTTNSSSTPVLTSKPANDTAMKTDAIFRPHKPIHLPTNDINLTVQRRSNASYGLQMVTSIAHVWFNCFFEGNGPENTSSSSSHAKQPSHDHHLPHLHHKHNTHTQSPETNDTSVPTIKHGPDQNGIYTITWDAMDGLKGSSRKGARAFDEVAVVWRVVPNARPSASPVPVEPLPESKLGRASHVDDADTEAHGSSSGTGAKTASEELEKADGTGGKAGGILITEPAPGDPIIASQAADWRGGDRGADGAAKANKKFLELGSSEGSPMISTTHLNAQTWGEKTSGAGNAGSGNSSEKEAETESDEDGVEGIQRGVREL